MTNEQKWKQRFLLYALVRIAGLGVMFIGIAIALGDLIRPGGWPLKRSPARTSLRSKLQLE